ncbi:MAG: alpha-1,3-mannosyltransferase family protein [Bacteroidales bacterium]|nr:alpha-1,3-mannosyltransferase family protein [Bacteroidales bacterium]NLK82302.1 hypothetical protein [Bacteroidales bacterium]
MKGIVIAVPKKYEKICLENVLKIRQLKCMLPIEIWEVGEEISSKIRTELAKNSNLTFKNVNDFSDNNNHWKGFQIKAFILFHTSFDEVFLCDSDVIVHQNPILLFEDENYVKTGTYFFKDLEKWQFSKLNNKWVQLRQKIAYNKFTNASFFLKRKKWIISLLPEKSPFFPSEWDYIYSENIPNKPVKEALQESGVVVMNKKKHEDSVKYIYDLNDNHKETYKYIWGDKETFWIGCLMANKSFYFNPTSGYILNETGKLTHDYNGKIFFNQKG